LSGANIVISGTNGAKSGNYYILTSTNLGLPSSNWLRLSTNPFDAAGNFIFTNPLDPAQSQLFYFLQLQ
jgi:hypothetical protein